MAKGNSIKFKLYGDVGLDVDSAASELVGTRLVNRTQELATHFATHFHGPIEDVSREIVKAGS